MMIPKVGKVAGVVGRALEKTSAPRLAAVAGCGTQSIYNYRDATSLPSPLAIPGLAKALGLRPDALRKLIEFDRRHATTRTARSRA